jgi:hypothetical protein
MANTFTVVFKDKASKPISYRLYLKEVRISLINALFRRYSICFPRGGINIIKSLSFKKLRKLSEMTSISQPLASTIIHKVLRELYYLSTFFQSYKFPWEHRKSLLFKKSKIYLHKLYKLAPIFNYNRAKTNLKTLHMFFNKASFWPTISTQLAMTIYLTDVNEPFFENKILIENIRAITYCSAYAFYRTKNKMLEKGVFIQ